MSTTVTANKDAVLKKFKNGTAATKKLLSELFDKEIFEGKITDRIKTFEDACKVLKLDPLKTISKTDTKDEAAYKKLKIIIRALNEGWTPNWNNEDEYKYYPWFNMEKGFELNVVFYYNSYSYVSSRLCFKNEELAKYAVKQFLSIYKDYFTV